MNDKKCNYCNKPELNTRQNYLKIQKITKQNEEINKKICKCKKVIKQNEEINYDLKNLIKELIIHKYFT